MRFLPAFLLTVAAFAQATPQAAPEAKATTAPAKPEDQAKPAEPAKPADTPAPAAASGAAATASPAPSGDPWITGSFDFGYRWVSDVRGSLPTYRSVVNLGSGPKLTGLDFTILDPKHRWFDRLDARANAWGGDPYNTAHLEVRKKNILRAQRGLPEHRLLQRAAFLRQPLRTARL